MRRRRPAAVLARVLIVVATVAVLPSPVLASPEEDLESAQRRANAAAAELADAEEELAHAEDEVTQLQARVVAADARVTAVRDQVRQLAIRLYVDGTGSLSRLLRMTDANQVIRAQQFGHVLAGTSTDSLRQYRVEREDLRSELDALERKQESQADALENLRRRRTEAIREIERLTAVAAQARAARDAERRAETAAPQAARQAAPASPAAAGTERAQGLATTAVDPPSLGAPTLSAAAPPAPTSSPPPDAAPAPAPAAASGGWICPVQGPLAFSDDYGASRGGGYSHMGNDILAARGTPVVASVSGYVTQRSGAISGLAYYLDGDDGNEYFGAHLDSFGASGRVTAGTVIGTVGNTGDAAGGPPHLHFEIHPGGGAPINPYPTLTRYC